MWCRAAIPEKVKAVEGFVQVSPACRLWFSDTKGSGPAVVLLHSGALSASGWDYQQPVLACAGFRVVTYARRRCAPSVCEGEDQVDAFAVDDLRALVLHLGLGRIHLVGAGLGAWFVADYALSHPDDVLSIAVVSSHLGISEPDWQASNARLKPPFFASLPDDFKELSPSYRAGDAEGVDAWNARHKDVGSKLQSATRHMMTWATLETIRVPTLLLTGDGDLYLPPSMLRLLASHIKHAVCAVVSEAGHNPYWEKPAEFNDHLLSFLRGNA
jgi:pimeloyl-ACP methyl ester carboxylesterase